MLFACLAVAIYFSSVQRFFEITVGKYSPGKVEAYYASTELMLDDMLGLLMLVASDMLAMLLLTGETVLCFTHAISSSVKEGPIYLFQIGAHFAEKKHVFT